MFNNSLPLVTTDPNKLEEQAKQFLKTESYNYVAGGAGERATMDANRLAFRQWKLVPRMMRVTERDLRVELFGEIYSKFISFFVYGKSCYRNLFGKFQGIYLLPLVIKKVMEGKPVRNIVALALCLGDEISHYTTTSSSLDL